MTKAEGDYPVAGISGGGAANSATWARALSDHEAHRTIINGKIADRYLSSRSMPVDLTRAAT
jgi:hypothetical protein